MILTSYQLIAACGAFVGFTVFCAAPCAGQTVSSTGIQAFDRLIAAGEYEAVEVPLEEYTTEHPESSDGWYQLGYVYYRLHKIWPSVEALSRSLALDPARADAHRILGHDFTILGRIDLAIEEFRRAVALDPKSVESHYALGRVHYENGDYGLAADHLSKVTELDGGYVKAWHNLGLALEAMNEHDRAQQSFVKAIELQQTIATRSEWPYLDFAGYLNRQNEPERALDLLREAESINPESHEVQYEIAKAHRTLEQWEPAVAAIQKAIRLNGEKAEYHYSLSLLCRKLGWSGQSRAALAEFERLKNAETSAERR